MTTPVGQLEPHWNRSIAHDVCTVMGSNGRIRIAAISGSLRRASSNSALVGAVALLAPDLVEVSIYGELGELPPFNPDLMATMRLRP